jgi:transposase
MRSLPKQTIASACLDVAEELASQPLLFDSNLLPVDVPILRAAKRLTSTGQIAGKDEATALGVAACKLAGLSDRETAKRLGISHSTVRGVFGLLTASGRVPAASDRLASRLGEVAESATEEIGRLITDANGDWTSEAAGAVRALGIAVGIAVDKSQLLTGQATAIVEQRAAPPADVVREYEAKLRQMFGQVIDVSVDAPDVPSGDSPPKSLMLSEAVAPGATIDTRTPVETTPKGGGGGLPSDPPAETTTHSIE